MVHSLAEATDNEKDDSRSVGGGASATPRGGPRRRTSQRSWVAGVRAKEYGFFFFPDVMTLF